jgi:predicted nucleotide-binding protein
LAEPEDLPYAVVRDTAPQRLLPELSTGKVFVVHGHGGVEHAVAGFLRKLGLDPVILHEQANEGRTIIEKFEAHSDVGFAVVLLTPDDVGGLKDGPQRPRARQNVILELGYFVGSLGSKKVCPLIQGEVELPSHVLGVAWVALDAHDGWHKKLANELRAAGYEFDFNKVLA